MFKIKIHCVLLFTIFHFVLFPFSLDAHFSLIHTLSLILNARKKRKIHSGYSVIKWTVKYVLYIKIYCCCCYYFQLLYMSNSQTSKVNWISVVSLFIQNNKKTVKMSLIEIFIIFSIAAWYCHCWLIQNSKKQFLSNQFFILFKSFLLQFSFYVYWCLTYDSFHFIFPFEMIVCCSFLFIVYLSSLWVIIC